MVRSIGKVQHDSVFIHIPRTGGEWLKRQLRVSGLRQHWVHPTYYRRIPNKHALLGHSYGVFQPRPKYLFSIVRHPVNYYESVYKWLSLSNEGRLFRKRWTWHPFLSAWRWYTADFNSWMERMLVEEPAWYSNLLTAYVGPESGEFCNYIGRTETLPTDADRLIRILGGDLVEPLPLLNGICQKIERDAALQNQMLQLEVQSLRRFYSEQTAEQREYSYGWPKENGND